MTQSTHRRWFEVWGSEEAQNHFLKGLLLFFGVLCTVEGAALAVLGSRKPVVFAVTPGDTRPLRDELPVSELLEQEVRRTATAFLAARYTWEWGNIEGKISLAAKFVAPESLKTFLAELRQQAKAAREKRISQRLHVTELSIDLKAKSIRAAGDRILSIGGLKVASSLEVELKYELGLRTEANPSGVYIAGEVVTGDLQRRLKEPR